jgi:hypothetical protein
MVIIVMAALGTFWVRADSPAAQVEPTEEKAAVA